MNYSDWTPPAADNLDLIKTQRQLKQLVNPFLNGKEYFLDLGDKQIYVWDNKYFSLEKMDYVMQIKQLNKIE